MLAGVSDVAELFAAAGCRGSLHAVRLSDGAEVGHDADRLHVMASVVKVPIALELYAQAAAGALDPAAPITLLPSRRTDGPVGISRFRDPATVSLRDLAYLMLTISDNAATDTLTDAVGIEAVNDRLRAAGCVQTVVVGDLRSLLDGVATDLGFADYTELLAAQRGALGPESEAAASDARRIDRCQALDPSTATRTTAREATRLLAAIWADTAAPVEACATLRSVMAEQVTRRLGPAVLDGGSIAAKSGALFGRVRNEIGVVSDPDGQDYAVAVLTRAHAPFIHHNEINAAMATTAEAVLDELRHR
jgi:beta-lactamase class A